MDRVTEEISFTVMLLRLSDIRCTTRWEPDVGYRLSIGGEANLPCASAVVDAANAAQWLAEQAMALYPGSEFARVRRMLADAMATAAVWGAARF